MAKSLVNLAKLREAIRHMTYQQGIYKVLREELTALGYWRNKPRGDPSKGYRAMKEKKGG